jgi:hypothetical protein
MSLPSPSHRQRSHTCHTSCCTLPKLARFCQSPLPTDLPTAWQYEFFGNTPLTHTRLCQQQEKCNPCTSPRGSAVDHSRERLNECGSAACPHVRGLFQGGLTQINSLQGFGPASAPLAIGLSITRRLGGCRYCHDLCQDNCSCNGSLII